MNAFFAAKINRRFAGTSICPSAATDPKIERVADCARRNFASYGRLAICLVCWIELSIVCVCPLNGIKQLNIDHFVKSEYPIT